METEQNECPTAILIDFGVGTSTPQMSDDKASQRLEEQFDELLDLSKSIVKDQAFLENPPKHEVIVGQLVSLKQDVCVAIATEKNIPIQQDVAIDYKASSSNTLKMPKCQYEVADTRKDGLCFQNLGLRTPSPKTMSKINTEASRIIEQLDSTSSETSLWDEEFPMSYSEDDDYFELPNKAQVIPDCNPSLHVINTVENKFPLEDNLIAEDSSVATECPNIIEKVCNAPAVITLRLNDNFSSNIISEDPTWSPVTTAEDPIDPAEDRIDVHTSDDISIAESIIGTVEDSLALPEYPIALVDPIAPTENVMAFTGEFIDPVEDAIADAENYIFLTEDPISPAESYLANEKCSSIIAESYGVNEKDDICKGATHVLAPMERYKGFVTPIKYSEHKEKENTFQGLKAKTMLSAKSSKIGQYRFPIKSILGESKINTNESLTSRSNIESPSRTIATEKYSFEKEESKSMSGRALNKPSLLKRPNTFHFHSASSQKTALYKSQSMVDTLNSGVAIHHSNSIQPVQYSQTPRKQASCSTVNSHSKSRISLNLPRTGIEFKTPMKNGIVVPKTPGLQTLGLPNSFNVSCSSKSVVRGSQIARPLGGSAIRRVKPPVPNTPQAIVFQRPTAASTSSRSRLSSRLELPSPRPKIINENLPRKLFPDSETPRKK